jgi:hypothetical protein
MADRGPVKVVAALGADQPSDVGGQHHLEHLQARPNRQSEQPLASGAGQLGDRDGHLLGQLELGLVGGGAAVGILRHGGPPSGRVSWRLPDTYHTAGLRRGPPPQLLRGPENLL